MPAMDPTAFGRNRLAREFEKQAQKAQEFKSAIEGLNEELAKTYGKDLIKKGADVKKVNAEIASAIGMVSKELRGTTKNAEEYGKAVARDTQLLLAFKEKHKLTIAEATAMYRKLNEEQQKQTGFFASFKGRIARFAAGYLTMDRALAVYRKRLDEIHTGHNLFLASTAGIIVKGKEAFQGTQKYITGYRNAMRSAYSLVRKYGVSLEEAESLTKALAFSMRATGVEASVFGAALKKDADHLFAFAKIMNVQVGDALQFFRDQMLVHGKTHKEARASLDQVMGAYDKMAVGIKSASRPMKEDYLATIKSIQQELGPTQVATQALTSVMNTLALAGEKAGLTQKGVVDAMSALPRMAKQLPRFFRIQIGSKIMEDLSSLPPKLRKQVDVIKKSSLNWYQKAEFIQGITAGTTGGLKYLLKRMKAMGSVYRDQLINQMQLTPQQKIALFEAFRPTKGGKSPLDPERLDETIANLKKLGIDAKKARKSLPDALREATKGMDKLALRIFDAETTAKEFMAQNMEYSIPAMLGLTAAMNASALITGLGVAGGAIRGLVGAIGLKGLGLIGAIGALSYVSYKVLKALDDATNISGKLANVMWALDGIGRKMYELEMRKKLEKGVGKSAEREFIKDIKKFEIAQSKGIKYLTGKDPVTGKTRKEALTREKVRDNLWTKIGGDVKAGKISQKNANKLMQKLEKYLQKFPTKAEWKAPTPEEEKKVRERLKAERKKEQEKQKKKAERPPTKPAETDPIKKQMDEAKQRRAQVDARLAALKLRRPVMPSIPTRRVVTPSQRQAPPTTASGGGGGTSKSQGLQPQTQFKYDSQLKALTGTFTLNVTDPAHQKYMTDAVTQVNNNLKRGR